MSPESMAFAAKKVRDSGNNQVVITERGTSFGYNDLMVDFRGIPTMKTVCESPVIMDCTHSLQQPNQGGGVTGGRPEMIETIVKAAIAVGADGLFIETHPNPSMAKSDGANMLDLSLLEDILIKEGDMFLLPPRIPHSPQRPANTIGLVIERYRRDGEEDKLMWFCENCNHKLYYEPFSLKDIETDLPIIFDKFYDHLQEQK